MDFQFYGANCISISYKSARLVIDDNLKELGKKTVVNKDDVALFTSNNHQIAPVGTKMTIDNPGEYEVADFSITGIPARAHTGEEKTHDATMYKITANDISVLITGHIYPQFNDDQLETIGLIDVLIVPVGGHGYTLDPNGALTIVKELEPKLVIPTHFEDKSLNYPVPQIPLGDALKELAMEPRETLAKLKLKSTDLTDVTQLIVLQKD